MDLSPSRTVIEIQDAIQDVVMLLGTPRVETLFVLVEETGT